MQEISTTQIRVNIKKILKILSKRGRAEKIVLTRYGKPIATITKVKELS